MAAAAAVLLAGGGVYYFMQKPKPTQAADQDPKKPAAPVKQPVTVVSVTPSSGATGVNGGAQIRVVFSSALSPSSPMPTLKPAIAGTWQRSGAAAVFTPARGFPQHTKVKVTIPGGSAGVQSVSGGLLATPQTLTFKTGRFNQIRIEQLLAQLGYMPLTWAPTSGTAPPLSDANAQMSAAYSPPQGTYTWQPGYPDQLHRLWNPDAPSKILTGAVMAFESDHGLALDGVVGPSVWRAMFKAIAHNQTNPHGYTYALTRESTPETLTVWHNGSRIFHHLANTGVPGAPTVLGTDPVYIRYQYQIMRGHNLDGSKYADPVWWVAYFHSGEAIHYFPRPGYGWPQSLGCVELPYNQAKSLWPYLSYGTLVTVAA